MFACTCAYIQTSILDLTVRDTNSMWTAEHKCILNAYKHKYIDANTRTNSMYTPEHAYLLNMYVYTNIASYMNALTHTYTIHICAHAGHIAIVHLEYSIYTHTFTNTRNSKKRHTYADTHHSRTIRA